MNLFLFQLKCDILISKIKRKKKEDFDLANKKLKKCKYTKSSYIFKEVFNDK